MEARLKQPGSAADPLWYKDAIIYELHVKAFMDSNNDGIGDFQGLLSKLDYLQDLGVTCLWLLPFFPSPLRDDGYDIADYLSVHPNYGTMEDFREFLIQAHNRGLQVITSRPRSWAIEEAAEIGHRAVGGIHVQVVGNVVAVVRQWRGIKRQQPQRGDAQVLQIAEILRQAAKIADAVAVAIQERADVKLINDRVLVPRCIGYRRARCRRVPSSPWQSLLTGSTRTGARSAASGEA